jgi:large subunit ribosomal protein L14
MRHEVVEAVIVRQVKEYRRRNGLRICFEDNAAVLINERGEPRGTRLKGPIAKEAVERFSTVGKIASTIV